MIVGYTILAVMTAVVFVVVTMSSLWVAVVAGAVVGVSWVLVLDRREPGS
jgi:hypothetical protein